MKKVLTAVVVVILLAAGYFLYSRSKSASPTGGMMGEGKVESGMMSIKDLVAAGVPQKCTFSMTSESGTNEGTNYVSGGNVRGDYKTTYKDKTTMTHMISDGKNTYVWTEGEKTGYKMSIPEETSEDSMMEGKENTEPGANLSEKLDFNCSAWVPDNSLFTPPSDVTFSDFSQMMPSGAPAMMDVGTSSKSQCSYCDGLSGDQKTQCLSALNCQ